MTRKEELLNIIDTAKAELTTIYIAEDAITKQKYVGKCYICPRRDSGGASAENCWDVYVYVVGHDVADFLDALTFEMKGDGNFEVRRQHCTSGRLGDCKEITLAEWTAALNRFVLDIRTYFEKAIREAKL